jgi:hypothetical protein
MWHSKQVARRKRFTQTASPRPASPLNEKEEGKGRRKVKGHTGCVVLSSVVPCRLVRGHCSAPLLRFAHRSLRSLPPKHMFCRLVCCSILFLGSLFIVTINSPEFITFWWNPAALGSSFRKRPRLTSRSRSKPFPIMGFFMTHTDGSIDTKPFAGHKVISGFVEASMFQPDIIMNDTSISPYHAFDDDTARRKIVRAGLHKDLTIRDTSKPNKCTRTAFHRAYHPNCNVFHEIDILFDIGDGYLGYYNFLVL